jgi:hypothetical protein
VGIVLGALGWRVEQLFYHVKNIGGSPLESGKCYNSQPLIIVHLQELQRPLETGHSTNRKQEKCITDSDCQRARRINLRAARATRAVNG